MSRYFEDLYWSLSDEEREEYNIRSEMAENECKNVHEKLQNSIEKKDLGQMKILLSVSKAMRP